MKIKLKNTPEQVELVKAMGSRDVTVAREEDCGINGDYFEMRDLMLPPTNM